MKFRELAFVAVLPGGGENKEDAAQVRWVRKQKAHTSLFE
jgi:hypothetical protein